VTVGQAGDPPRLGATASSWQLGDGVLDIQQRGEPTGQQPVEEDDGLVRVTVPDEPDGGVDP
jgi:hypothetical protein